MRFGLIGLNGDPCRSPRNTIVVNPVRPGREQRQRQSGVGSGVWIPVKGGPTTMVVPKHKQTALFELLPAV